MSRLWVKLLAAFAAVLLIGMIVTVLVARQAAATQLTHFMVGNLMIRPATLERAAGAYYTAHGSWDGLAAQFPTMLRGASSGGMMGGIMGGMMNMFDSRIRVVDAAGTVVADTAGRTGAALPADAPGTRRPITVDGRVVGTLVIDGAPMDMPGTVDRSLLNGVTRAVATGSLVAGLVALALAALFVRQITRPVAALGRAAQQIEAGNLAARVDVRSQDELGGLGHAFNRMALALQEQERLRRNLVADVAHELRTPLSGIQGTVEALQDGVFPLDAASLEPIHAQALLLNRLVDDLRTLALADAGELALNMDTVNLTALLTRACEGLRGNAQAGHVELVYTPSAQATPIMVRGDAARLTQVAVNLLDNALQHTPSGGVVTVTTQLVDATVVWRVTDTGSGIAAEDLPHIFERFYRTDRSRSRATGGSGLGLAIVKQIVLAHGGTVAVHSPPPEQARGTQFVVTLPIHT